MNFYGQELAAHKAALHMHSTTSDGQFTPAEMIEAYAAQGYEIYAFTDHHRTNPVSTYDSKGMTLISGMEIHPQGPRSLPWHLLSLGVPEDFAPPQGTGQDCIDAVNAVGGIMFCAHPYWCGFRSTEVAELHGLIGIEVYNTSTRYIGKCYNMTIWDELSDMGIVYPAIAVDDAHSMRDRFMGWTNILTNEPLSQASVLKALREGHFYASQGPEFKRLSYENGVFEAEFSPCVEVIGLSNNYHGYLGMVENVNGPQDGLQEVTSCQMKLKANIANSWFRLQIKDRNGKYAWSNPIKLN